jgi:hypothetical protein
VVSAVPFTFGPNARLALAQLRLDEAAATLLASAIELDRQLVRLARLRRPSPATVFRRLARKAQKRTAP